MTYKKDVIDIGDRASKLAHKISVESYKNSPAVRIVPHTPNNFRGPVGWVWQKHILMMMMREKMTEEMENDGAGGKPQLFSLIGTPEVFQNLGWEIITMCADDFARSGRLPVIIANDLNIKRLTEKNFPLFEALMSGYGKALKKAGLINITGETAIMRHSVTAFCETGENQLVLNWGAACVGLCHRDKLIDGSKIRPGMPIVGFIDEGFRCNGATFLIDLILRKWGPDINKIIFRGDLDSGRVFFNNDALKFITKLTSPSVSYSKLISAANGWEADGRVRKPIVKMAGIAHITGGGIWHKFGEILPPGVGAYLDFIPPHSLLSEVQKTAAEFPELALSDLDMYETFHGGCGMFVVCENGEEVRKLFSLAKDFKIGAVIAGRTTESSEREILVKSWFYERAGQVLSSIELKTKNQ